MKRESPLLSRLLMWASNRGWRLFRNDTGQAWVGKLIAEYDSSAGRIAEIARAKRIRYGLTKGSADLIGWRPVRITPEMVGSTIAQFAAVEAKTAGDRVRKEQRHFLSQVAKSGGYAAIGRDGENGPELEEVKR